MTDNDRSSEMQSSAPAPRVVACADLDAAIAHYTEQLGFRLDMIMPADAPRVALLSGNGTMVRLEVRDDREVAVVPSRIAHEFMIARANATNAWIVGRAGMQYRDLVPGRLDGRVIASHIRIPDGGPVPDYVHYHKVGFQMIYCKRGWVRVVYEDQGPPFVMHAGDCVLQPPTIRHRVLEASPGFEVIEISSPAEHETWRDHALDLPTIRHSPDRLFGGQRFVRHVAADAQWQRAQDGCIAFRDIGISDATDGVARVRVLRVAPGTHHENIASQVHDGEFLFLVVLDGCLEVMGQAFGIHTLESGDACVIPQGADYVLEARLSADVLEVALRTIRTTA
jgi:quercetin dioxygenase-like cupin family protein